MSANGYSARNYLKKGATITLGASETDTVVSEVFRVSAGDSLYLNVYLTADNTTVATGITANLQHSYDGGTTWLDVGSNSQVSITGDADFQIKHKFDETNDQVMWPMGRVVVSTGAGDAADITAVRVTRRL
jgi:hypothetical protein